MGSLSMECLLFGDFCMRILEGHGDRDGRGKGGESAEVLIDWPTEGR
jgi:hypothetical protein